MLARLRRVRSCAWRRAQSIHLCQEGSSEERERDVVNFPKPVQAENPGPVRLGVVPEEWFTFFYPRTGVTGPYVWFAAVATCLCSKEIYVLEHNFYNGLSVAALCAVAVKKLGPWFAEYADREIAKEADEWNTSVADDKRWHEEEIADELCSQWRADGQLMLLAAKRDNVALQLEAEYRRRLWSVYAEVMRRLDCAADLHATERRVHHQHIVRWVVAEVIKAITPEMNDLYVRACIQEIAKPVK